MGKKQEYPKEINKISQILGYAEEHEEDEEDKTKNDINAEPGEEEDEADSSHYSVGGDNGL